MLLDYQLNLKIEQNVKKINVLIFSQYNREYNPI